MSDTERDALQKLGIVLAERDIARRECEGLRRDLADAVRDRQLLAAEGDKRAKEIERLRAAAVRPVASQGHPMNRRKGRMVQASELLKEIQDIMQRFGDTCFYITGMAWGSVALWQESDIAEALKETTK